MTAEAGFAVGFGFLAWLFFANIDMHRFNLGTAVAFVVLMFAAHPGIGFLFLAGALAALLTFD